MIWALLVLSATALAVTVKMTFLVKTLERKKSELRNALIENKKMREEKRLCINNGERRAKMLKEEIRRRDETISELSSPDNQRRVLNDLLSN